MGDSAAAGYFIADIYKEVFQTEKLALKGKGPWVKGPGSVNWWAHDFLSCDWMVFNSLLYCFCNCDACGECLAYRGVCQC